MDGFVVRGEGLGWGLVGIAKRAVKGAFFSISFDF